MTLKRGEVVFLIGGNGSGKPTLAMLLAVAEQRDLLLLDEWAADQDPQFRRVFCRELLPQLRALGKTLVVLSHDDHYFDKLIICWKCAVGN